MNQQLISKETEQTLLGGLINNIDLNILTRLEASDFYTTAHQEVFLAMVELQKEGKQIDIPSLLKGTITTGLLVDLSDRGCTTSARRQHLEKIKELSQRRKVVSLCDDIKDRAIAGDEDLFSKLTKGTLDVTEKSSTQRLASELSASMIEHLEAPAESLIKTGYSSLDQGIGGFAKGQYTLIAGRPSQGKSAFCENIVEKIAKDHHVYYVSAESSEREFSSRMIGRLSGVGHNKLGQGGLSIDESLRVNSAIDEMSKWKLTFEDNPSITSSQIFMQAQKLKLQGRLDIVFVDYLQILGDKRDQNEYLRIGDISRTLKTMARTLNVPVVVACQLNRQSEARAENVPSLSDLRDSGQLEQDADMVLGLWTPEFEGNLQLDKRNIRILKNRHGSLATIPFHFVGRLVMFTLTTEAVAKEIFK